MHSNGDTDRRPFVLVGYGGPLPSDRSVAMHCTGLDDCEGNATGNDRRVATDHLDGRLRDCARTVTGRELRTALNRLDGLTPAQRRTVARMADRIAAGVLAPARARVEAGDAERRAVARLFDPEPIRDQE